MLNSGVPEKYQLALGMLLPEVRKRWGGVTIALQGFQKYEPTPEDLLRFIEDEIIPHYPDRLYVLSRRDEAVPQAQAQAQAQADSMGIDTMEKIRSAMKSS